MIPQAGHSSYPTSDRRPSAPRVVVSSLSDAAVGSVLPLEPGESHHLVHVRRVRSGQHVEVFDETGLSAPARVQIEGQETSVVLLEAPGRGRQALQVVVFSALPKGNRADWMVEKLAELGVAEFVPLKTERAVVDPGVAKLQRLTRIAREAAKQSRSGGVMKVTPPTSLKDALDKLASSRRRGAVLTTERPGTALAKIGADVLFIGPEGGWTDAELDAIVAAGATPARLTETVLRVETAAVCAAAVVLCMSEPNLYASTTSSSSASAADPRRVSLKREV